MEFSTGLPSGSRPVSIAPGPDGNEWFTDEGTHAIGRITPTGQITEFTDGLNPGAAPKRIALGPDGNLWFTDQGTTPAVGRITPTGQITEFSALLNSGTRPIRIAPGNDGNVWFTDTGTTPAIGKITPNGTITEFSSGLSATRPGGITAGPDGAEWFTDTGTTPSIWRITPTGTVTQFTAGLNAGSYPASITAGPDGDLWFGDEGSTRAIGTITPAGVITEYNTGNNGSMRIAPGSDGSIWLSGTMTIGWVGTGTAQALVNAPVISGSGRAGTTQSCQDAWASWLGHQPSRSALPFDGYRWLLDGVAIPGATSQTYVPPAGATGHHLACQVTVTYGIPLQVSAGAASGVVTVLAPVPPPPARLGASITRAKIQSRQHRASFSFTALGGTASGFQCALVRQAGRGQPPPRPTFRSCRSPKGYQHLPAGRYTFSVRALNRAGVAGRAASKHFTIAP